MQNQIEEQTAVEMKLAEIDTCLTNLIEGEHFTLKQIISRTDDIIQKNQNDLTKTQEWMMRQIKSVKGSIREISATGDENDLVKDTSMEPLNYSYLHTKTLEIIIALNRQLNDTNHLDTSKEGIYDIAFDWVQLVDKNNQGGIDLTEFYRSFMIIDDFVISDQDVINIFKMFDVNGDGEISIQELAKAISRTIDFCMKEGGQELFDKLLGEGAQDDQNGVPIKDENVKEKAGGNNRSLQ